MSIPTVTDIKRAMIGMDNHDLQAILDWGREQLQAQAASKLRPGAKASFIKNGRRVHVIVERVMVKNLKCHEYDPATGEEFFHRIWTCSPTAITPA